MGKWINMSGFGHFPGWDEIDGSSVSKEEVEAAYQVVTARAFAIEEYLAQQHRRKRMIWRRSILAVAAALALIIVPSLSIWFAKHQVHQVQSPARMLQFATACGEIKELVLPDNSRVTLNAQSVLIYPETFGKERTVYLSGEALFDVTASKESPFYVQTSDITVSVHGTLFNVNAYFDSPTVKATLSRGAISVWPNESPERIVKLEPDQQFSYERATGAITSSNIKARESTSWTNGDLCFRSASIHEIIRIAQRHYGVQVYLSSDKYDNAIITARFVHGETVDEFMDAICGVVPHMKYIHSENSIYIK
jgi:ferric-dicitrate binding protein FerR (iron transport regulator)